MSSSHYDAAYWAFQSRIGRIGGKLNKFKFEKHVNAGDTLLDFGCGGGYLLAELEAADKWGFDVNPHARAQAETLGVHTVEAMAQLPDAKFDVVVSNHALEHVPRPLEALQEICRVLRPGGVCVIVVPCEQASEQGFAYRRNDVNQHLYTWCPQALGNLLGLAGLTVQECSTLRHKWPADYETACAQPDFHQRCVDYAHKVGNYQVKAVARKPVA